MTSGIPFALNVERRTTMLNQVALLVGVAYVNLRLPPTCLSLLFTWLEETVCVFTVFRSLAVSSVSSVRCLTSEILPCFPPCGESFDPCLTSVSLFPALDLPSGRLAYHPIFPVPPFPLFFSLCLCYWVYQLLPVSFGCGLCWRNDSCPLDSFQVVHEVIFCCDIH